VKIFLSEKKKFQICPEFEKQSYKISYSKICPTICFYLLLHCVGGAMEGLKGVTVEPDLQTNTQAPPRLPGVAAIKAE
jgi:hypothetical protein